ncbi:LamG domain-containing protein [Streptomyces sp. NPDC048430]|uniref:LamG domain-containing protein n=1 Tax=Streptomyces sp. NPDC048430 TaxID=3155388 RepID=UPI00343CA5CE
MARTALVAALASATAIATPWASATENHVPSQTSLAAPTSAVAAETPPVAAWRLDDPYRSSTAAPWAGPYRGQAGSDVWFGDQGPDGRMPGAASFDGGSYSYVNTDATAVDTTHAFTAGVWVRPDNTDDDMIAIGQSGISSTPNFTLGMTTTAGKNPTWSFALPSEDGQTQVTGGTPQAGEWAYLTGAYDPVAGTARLYVDGALVAVEEASVPQDTALWTFVMGRDGYDFSRRLEGDLSDVRVWDSAVQPAEIAELGRRKPRPTAYWQMEAVEEWGDGVKVIPEVDHRADFILYGDTHVTTDAPLAGSGSVSLDGDGDYLESDIPPLNTGQSWAVSAKVRLRGVPDRDMAVLSQTGLRTDAFTLRYQSADRTWRASLAHADEPDAETTDLIAPAPGGIRTLLLQYDAKASRVELYVDGEVADSAPYAAADVWEAVRFLQVGRDSATDGNGAHYLHGDVDEVHTWAGVLSGAEIGSLQGQ